MKLFDNHPQAKAMQSLIHDTRNLGDVIRHNAKKLQEWFKDQKFADYKPWIHLEYVTGKTKEMEKAIDLYYEQFSNDFPDNISPDFKPEIPTAYNLVEQFMPEGDWKGDKLTLYNAFNSLIENYTLIRKTNNNL